MFLSLFNIIMKLSHTFQTVGLSLHQKKSELWWTL